MNKKRIQPSNMINSPVFSQAVEISNTSATIYVGGQNAVDREGAIVGKDDFAVQCKQALSNLKTVLESADCSIGSVVKWTIFMVQGNDPRLGFKAFQEVFGAPEIPPVLTVIQVAGLANPDCLIEVEAIAVK